jgi:hypothetical protein
MSTIPAKETERNRDEPDGRDHVVSLRQTCHGKERLQRRLGSRQMRVSLCARCSYAPQHLAGHYDPEGALHVCVKRDGQHDLGNHHYPRKAHRRQQCATFPNIIRTAQPSVARSATESLASSGTTLGEPPSVQRSALSASRHARTATADGYVDFKLPDNGFGQTAGAFFRSSGFRSKELAQ